MKYQRVYLPPLIVDSFKLKAGMNHQRWSYLPLDSSFLQIKSGNHLPVYHSEVRKGIVRIDKVIKSKVRKVMLEKVKFGKIKLEEEKLE